MIRRARENAEAMPIGFGLLLGEASSGQALMAQTKSKHIAGESNKHATALNNMTAHTNKFSEHMEIQLTEASEKMEKLRELITTIDERSRPK